METDAYRILGVADDATEKQIRQAYLDLARVWHPDRFQSDPRLQQVAQEHLRQINEAYLILKGRKTQQPRHTPPEAGGASPRHRKASPEWDDSRLVADFARWIVSSLDLRKIMFRVGVLVACFVPLMFAVRLLPLLRVPVVDIDLIAQQARIVRPQILAPARILDPSSDLRSAADILEEWARGEVMDLWKPAAWNASRAAVTISRTIPAPAGNGGVAKPSGKRAQSDRRLSDLANGTELLGTSASAGAGAMRLVNRTTLEGVAILFRQKVALRAVYIKPQNEVLLRTLNTGLYEVQLEFGRSLDLERRRFRQDRLAMSPVGPFEFFEVTTANGTAGQYYEVVISPP